MRKRIILALFIIVLFILFLDVLSRLGYIEIKLGSNKKKKLTQEESWQILGELLIADENQKLKRVDGDVREILNRMHYNYPSRLRKAGVFVNPYAEADYEEILRQLYEIKKEGKFSVNHMLYDLVGYSTGKPIVYILDHYKQWRKMKDNQ